MTSTALHHSSDERELAHRSSEGIDVSLFWSRLTNLLCIAVRDVRSGAAFELVVENGAEALDAFRHPFAHAAWRGVEYGLPGGAGA